MDGDLAPLPQIVGLAQKYDVLTTEKEFWEKADAE